MSKKQIDRGNIGDFSTSQVLDWNPISFTVEFLQRMRRNRKKLLNLPSTRQAVAIPKLITAMYYRKVKLIPEDFIKAAVITTPVEDQEIARQIAFDILFPRVSLSKDQQLAQKSDTKVGDHLDEEDEEDIDFMDELLSEIENVGLDLDNMDFDMDQSMKEFETLMDFVDDLYKKAAEGEEPYRSLLDILEQRSGYGDILGKNLNSLQTLEEYVHQIIKREMNVIYY